MSSEIQAPSERNLAEHSAHSAGAPAVQAVPESLKTFVDFLASVTDAPMRHADVDGCLHNLARNYVTSGAQAYWDGDPMAHALGSMRGVIAMYWGDRFPLDENVAKAAAFAVRQIQASETKPSASKRGSIAVTAFKDTQEEKPDWIWPGHILRKATHVLGGKQGSSKGLATVDIAARLSRGDTMPDGSGGGMPMRVLFVTREDDPGMALLPRLRVANADLTMVFWSHGDFADGTPIPTMEAGAEAIEATVREHAIDLVIVDPLGAWVEDDANNGQQIRAVIDPMNRMARKVGCAVLFVAHIRKAAAEDPMDAFAGSAQVTAAVRVAMLISKSADGKERIFEVAKTNFRQPEKPMMYRLASCGSLDKDDPPVLVWRAATREDQDAAVASHKCGGVVIPGGSLLPFVDNVHRPFDEACRLALADIRSSIPNATLSAVKEAMLSMIKHGTLHEGKTSRGGKTVGKLPQPSEDTPEDKNQGGVAAEAALSDADYDRIADWIIEHPQASMRDVATACQISFRHARKVMSDLQTN